ncbi:nucleotide exchange factor GrpE [Aeromicrobium massiliense]|uniref:nucleotide exchange factor GrpE n=1 Tax=Aeromicrobium massiliense TaxID=1464554 RepID=UPI00030808B7|nr:nucleotide exchange factor GrpE [Aeromicrobium massiliense]
MTDPADQVPMGEEPAVDAAADSAPQGTDENPAGEQVDETADLRRQLDERTADLQRLQAEYVNYKRRVDRDRELVRAQGAEKVLGSLLTVLDDVGRAGEHGELTGGFKAVADSLQQALKAHGLESFGQEGDVFDPNLHEAVFHAGESAEVSATTVHSVMRTGYKVGERVLRPATVGVVEPAEGASTNEESAASADAADES